MTQEAIRILRNTISDISWDRKAEMLTDFCLRMELSGYPEAYRLTIIQSAPKAWERMKEADRTGTRPLYREKEWMQVERQKEKERKKGAWYSKIGGKTSDFPLFCPMSPGGRLASGEGWWTL